MLATLFAPTDMARAQHYVSLYMQLGKEGISPNVALANDRRAAAFEKYAMGRVQQVIGNDKLAIATLQEAYDIFSAAGYRFRAALTAFALFEVTADGRWIERARADAAIYPNSALYRRVVQQPAEPVALPLRDLTPLQRQIVYALCEGLELGELSKRFSRSAFTLERHVEAIYKHFGLKNRAGLRDCMQAWNLI
jgi:DNA-binding NarL/FixJ family response regulator